MSAVTPAQVAAATMAFDDALAELGLTPTDAPTLQQRYAGMRASLETLAPVAGRIDARLRAPEKGLIVKGWDSGAVWAGHFDGSAKTASCDWWIPIAESEAPK